MELKVGLKYTCENNNPNWHGEITSIGTELIHVDLYQNNVRTGSGLDPIEKIINHFKTGYFKVKEDFVLPTNWCVKSCKELKNLLCEGTNVIGDYRNNYYYNYSNPINYLTDRNWDHISDLYHDFVEISFEQFVKYVLLKNKPNYNRLITILNFINNYER